MGSALQRFFRCHMRNRRLNFLMETIKLTPSLEKGSWEGTLAWSEWIELRLLNYILMKRDPCEVVRCSNISWWARILLSKINNDWFLGGRRWKQIGRGKWELLMILPATNPSETAENKSEAQKPKREKVHKQTSWQCRWFAQKQKNYILSFLVHSF